MLINYIKNITPAYVTPDCEACETLASVVLCQSGDIEEWVDDGNGFGEF